MPQNIPLFIKTLAHLVNIAGSRLAASKEAQHAAQLDFDFSPLGDAYQCYRQKRHKFEDRFLPFYIQTFTVSHPVGVMSPIRQVSFNVSI